MCVCVCEREREREREISFELGCEQGGVFGGVFCLSFIQSLF
jgi:hypothetical protein